MTGVWSGIRQARWISSLLFLFALILITGSVNHAFFSYDNILNCFNAAVVFTLLAVGIAFVIMTGEIDVSIGATMGLTAAIAGKIAQQHGSFAVMLLIAVAIGIVAGLINGLGVSFLGIPSLIFTLGTNGVIRGIVYIASGGKTIENYAGSFTNYGNKTAVFGITWYYLIVLVVVALAHLLTTGTSRGKYFIAVGDNAAGATLVGISVFQTKMTAYMLSGVFAGIAGVAFASKYGQVNIVAGAGYEMSAIAACVLGGISLSGGLGNMIGAAIGAVIMSSVSRMLVFINLPSNFNDTITGIMLITIVVTDALMQRRAVENARRKRLLQRVAPGQDGGMQQEDGGETA
ncbi:MAG: ABC transporter permease [Lachnospiraceae bacterium]|nr:ABC transporter permease [Lachnospiraceae bacterium]